MDFSIFEQVTSALTVKSICRPMGPDIPAGTSFEEMVEMDDQGLDPINNPSRVVNSVGDTIGVVWFEDYANAANTFEMLTEEEGAPQFIDDVMQDLEPNRLLSSNTTILDAVKLFTEKGSLYFYVIDINRIVGVLSYKDLFRPIGRIAFLTLALEIEELALDLCQSPKVAEECWLSISDGRKRKSIEIFSDRYRRYPRLKNELRDRISDVELRAAIDDGGDGTPELFWVRAMGTSDVLRLLACTALGDKATMIWKQKLIANTSRGDLLKFFRDLETIRNSCAHPGNDEPPLAHDRLAHFVNDATLMRSSLSEAMRKSADQ
jgi:hypothetical protein